MSEYSIVSENNSVLGRKNRIICDSLQVGKCMHYQCVTKYVKIIMTELDGTLTKSHGRKWECNNTLKSLTQKSGETSLPKFTLLPCVGVVWVICFLFIWDWSGFKISTRGLAFTQSLQDNYIESGQWPIPSISFPTHYLYF